MAVDLRAAWKEQIWDQEHKDRDDAIAAAIAVHADSEAHRRPWGRVDPFGYWTSGEVGTALTAMTTHPGMGWFHPRWPTVIHGWSAQGGPTGTATWTVKIAGPGVALASATTVLTCNLTVPETIDDTITPITVEPGSRWAAFLTAVGGSIEWTSFNLDARRT
jgi:hypothetical protein